jgi:serine/threonine protein kinase
MPDSVPFQNLRSLVSTRTRRIVVWCGAGLSAPAGIATWSILQRKLELQLQEKLESLSDINAAQKAMRLKNVRQEKNPWVAFYRLQNELGATSFREGVRAALARAVNASAPEAYLSMWKLRPAGVINLNLERLATKAFVENGGGSNVVEFKGKEIGSYAHVLQGPRQFICNIHGVVDDVDSWVFTQPTLRQLSASDSYKVFLSSVLMTTTVIFIGITADDVAVGGHLERLKEAGISSPTHFWLTDRLDSATDSWAEGNGIQVVRYSAADGHAELNSLLRDLATFVPPESDSAPPVALNFTFGSETIPPISALVAMPPEDVRRRLNSYASAILSQGDDEALSAYNVFTKAYDRAIHIAWYTATTAPDNIFLGLELVREVARGAFGIVFEARNRDGDQLAVKLLHAEIRKQPELLNAFRRGVRSLRILTESGIPGMAKYVGASEIPATLIMEWIEGSTLNNIVESNTLSSWENILEIAVQIATIISTAHELPQRVLHRDIRPANVMVSGFWENEPIAVTVLDFDLSWHRGSVEKSVIFGSALAGYLAPEQVQRREGVSTQHASVDSYGIGMTVFFMLARRNPVPGEHAHASWGDVLARVVHVPTTCNWKSVPNRVARLIRYATAEKQERRWDVTQITSELKRLLDALRRPTDVSSAELVAEEIAARSGIDKYDWDDKQLSIVSDFGTGLVVTISGDESGQEVVLKLERRSTESTNRNKLGELITRAKNNVEGVLASAGWAVRHTVGQGMLTTTATISVGGAIVRLDTIADAVGRAVEKMTFYS